MPEDFREPEEEQMEEDVEEIAEEEMEDVTSDTLVTYPIPSRKEEFLSLYGVLQALKVNRIGELEGIISRM